MNLPQAGERIALCVVRNLNPGSLLGCMRLCCVCLQVTCACT